MVTRAPSLPPALIAPIFVHRSRGTDQQYPGGWRFWCHLCNAAPHLVWDTPGHAGDVARAHLIHAHRFIALAKELNHQHGGTP